MTLTTRQLASLLQMPIGRARRLAVKLNLSASRCHGRLLYQVSGYHPLSKSLKLAEANSTKPLLSLQDIANLWRHFYNNFDRPYTTRRIKQILLDLNIPIQNQKGKGYVYLSHLKRPK